MKVDAYIPLLADAADTLPERVLPYVRALQAEETLPPDGDEITERGMIDAYISVIASPMPGAAAAAVRAFGPLPLQEIIEGGLGEGGSSFHGPRQRVADIPIPPGDGELANNLSRSLRGHLLHVVRTVERHPDPMRSGKWLSILRDLRAPEAQIFYSADDGKAHWLIFRRDDPALYVGEHVALQVNVPRSALVKLAHGFARSRSTRLAPVQG